MSFTRVILALTTAIAAYVGVHAQSRSSSKPPDSIQPVALKEWLTYLASDELQGREVYTEGLGLAASYIGDRLKEWRVKPAAPGGTYFQTVKVLGVKANSQSSVTIEVNGRSRTFKDGEGIAFPRTSTMGGKQVLTGEDVQFVGYGLQVPTSGVDDYAGIDPKGKVIVWLGASAPRTATGTSFRVLALRSRAAVEKGALAVIAPPTGRGARGAQAAGAASTAGPATPPAGVQPAATAPQTGRGGGRGGETADFTTAERYDRLVPPVVSAQDEFFEFLFSGSDVTYAELKELAAKQEPLPRFALKGVTLTFNVDPDYRVVSTRLSRNVVGIVEGSDPKLRDTYVAFGAHYDHIGYRQTTGGGFFADFGCPGQTRPEARPDDIVNNGADDDGSGTVALMAMARAFATGQRPKRSLVFVWHTGEESQLQGSRYNADHPVVPNEQIVALLNVDMVGRNRCDEAKEENTVYLVGSDRISTELHNISEEANASLPRPMTLDYELNDPADPQSFYTRSDHYSYAAKGIPIIFYTTGLHRDYHAVTDEVDKIDFTKLAHVTELIYTTGQRLANLDHLPVRDNQGPRMGKGRGGKIGSTPPTRAAR
jgi:hypothetical protein